MKDSKDIKTIAKYQFRQRYGMCVGAALLFVLLGAESSNQFSYRYIENLNIDLEWMLVFWSILLGIMSVMFFVYLLVGAPLRVGYAHFCRCIYNNWTTSVRDMFRRTFGDYPRNLGGMLWMDLFIFLWSLLLLIPGIIKALAYFAAPYLLAEFPAVRATDAIKISMRMTRGYKGDIFYVHLSFFGWHLLSGLTLGLLGLLYVNPYYYTTLAGVYEELKMNALNTGAVSYYELVGYPQQPGGYTYAPPPGENPPPPDENPQP